MNVGKWFSLFSGDMTDIKNNVRINCTRPKNYDKTLPLIVPSGYSKVDMKENYDFFADLVEKKIDLVSINHTNITEEGKIYKKCDYCKIISSSFPYRFCKTCDKSMCCKCWEEKTEEDAKKNGAKNYIKRKNDLQLCFSHIDKIEIKYNIPVNCDLCNGSSRDVFGKWSCDRKSNRDLCPSCSFSEIGTVITSKGNYEKVFYRDENYDLGYGSILDWVLVGKHEDEKEYLLYNINQNSTLYCKYGYIYIDDNDYKMVVKNEFYKDLFESVVM